MSNDADVVGVNVDYHNAEPQSITATGRYRGGEYRRAADYTFRMDGSTAVLTGIDTDGRYSVQLAEGAREAVRAEVAALPFVQAVEMFPEVSA